MRQRDYKAEYARRVTREQARATEESRPFSRARARGHINPVYERAQVRERKERKKTGAVSPRGSLDYWVRKTAFGIPLSDYEGIVEDAIDRVASTGKGLAGARRWMIGRLRTKYADTLEFLARLAGGMTHKQAADGSQGQAHYFSGRVEYVGVEVYWYHGNR